MLTIEARPRVLTWHKAAVGYTLREGFQARAVVIPNPRVKCYGGNRWNVDAIGLDKPRGVKTLREAKALAIQHA